MASGTSVYTDVNSQSKAISFWYKKSEDSSFTVLANLSTTLSFQACVHSALKDGKMFLLRACPEAKVENCEPSACLTSA